jgi:hypothetical protein
VGAQLTMWQARQILLAINMFYMVRSKAVLVPEFFFLFFFWHQFLCLPLGALRADFKRCAASL